MITKIQDFVNKLSDTGKKIFYFTIIVLSLAFLDRLFLGPILDRLSTIDADIHQQEETTKRDLRFLSYKDRILQNNSMFSKYFSAAKKDDDVVNAEFLSVFERLASQAKINLVKSNPSDAKKEKMYAQYSANLDCSGGLKEVIAFMHSINSNKDLLKVTRFNMTPKRGSEGEVNLSLTVAKLIVNPDIFEEKNLPKK